MYEAKRDQQEVEHGALVRNRDVDFAGLFNELFGFLSFDLSVLDELCILLGVFDLDDEFIRVEDGGRVRFVERVEQVAFEEGEFLDLFILVLNELRLLLLELVALFADDVGQELVAQALFRDDEVEDRAHRRVLGFVVGIHKFRQHQHAEVLVLLNFGVSEFDVHLRTLFDDRANKHRLDARL
jgi:hypothetical protein